MIFAELQYDGHYDTMHPTLAAFLAQRFRLVESGHQADSYFWIFDGGEKVAIDTFSSMTHQVKSARPGPHVQAVIRALRAGFSLKEHDPPLPEGHEAF